MSLHDFLIAGAVICLTCGSASAEDTPALGVAISEDQIQDLDFTILPDGEGLPGGSGTPATGLVVYRQRCLACHGESGSGGVNDELAGGKGSLAEEHPIKTIGSYWPYATTLFDYIRRAMPYPSPGTLSANETYAVTAYLLYVNGIIGKDTLVDKTTLPAVEMPNKDGFDRAYPPAD